MIKTEQQPGTETPITMKPSSTKTLANDISYASTWSYKKVIYKYLSLALPFSGSRIVDAIVEICTGILLATLGLKYLAAGALISTWQRFFIGTGLSIIYSMATPLARIKKDTEVGEIVQQGIILAVVISIPTIIITYFSGSILKLMGLNAEIAGIVNDFYRCGMISVFGIFFTTVQQQFTLCIERPKLSFIISIINGALVLGIGSTLTLGLFGLPALKARGMGYGYSVAFLLTAIGSTFYFLLKDHFRRYKLTKINPLNYFLIKNLLQLGLPYAFQMFSDFFMLYILNIIIGHLGIAQLSAVRVAEMVYMLPLIFIIRWPTATCYLGGQAIKNNNESLLRSFLFTNVGILLLFVTIWLGTSCLFSTKLINIFFDSSNQNNKLAFSFAKIMLWLYPLGLYSEIIRYAITGVLRGNGNAKTSMNNSLFWMLILGIPIIYLTFYLGGGLSTLYTVRNIILAGAVFSLIWLLVKNMTPFFSFSKSQNNSTKNISSISEQ
jgi:MATE family multidrug resistance protein